MDLQNKLVHMKNGKVHVDGVLVKLNHRGEARGVPLKTARTLLQNQDAWEELKPKGAAPAKVSPVKVQVEETEELEEQEQQEEESDVEVYAADGSDEVTGAPRARSVFGKAEEALRRCSPEQLTHIAFTLSIDLESEDPKISPIDHILRALDEMVAAQIGEAAKQGKEIGARSAEQIAAAERGAPIPSQESPEQPPPDPEKGGDFSPV
jgi:hypothetical protein